MPWCRGHSKPEQAVIEDFGASAFRQAGMRRRRDWSRVAQGAAIAKSRPATRAKGVKIGVLVEREAALGFADHILTTEAWAKVVCIRETWRTVGTLDLGVRAALLVRGSWGSVSRTAGRRSQCPTSEP